MSVLYTPKPFMPGYRLSRLRSAMK